jgi:ribosome-associated protein
MKVKITRKKKSEILKPVYITGDFIKLDALLKFTNISDSGGVAKLMIKDGLVEINGRVATERGKKVRPGDEVQVAGERFKIKRAKSDEGK